MTTPRLSERIGRLFIYMTIVLSTACQPGAAPTLTPQPTTPPLPAIASPAVSGTPVQTLEIPLGTGEWAPYTSEQMADYGAFTEIVSAVFFEMGVQPKYSFYPWKRAESEVAEGKVFAIFPYIETEERLKDFDFSDPVLISTGKFFYMPERQAAEITYDKFEELKPYRLGGVLGYWYEAPFKAAGLQVDYVSSDELNFQKLYLGRVDLVASEELVGWSLIKTLYPQEIEQFATVKQSLNEDPLRLLISRQYPGAAELTTRFNAALKVIREKGVVDKILSKYGLHK